MKVIKDQVAIDRANRRKYMDSQKYPYHQHCQSCESIFEVVRTDFKEDKDSYFTVTCPVCKQDNIYISYVLITRKDRIWSWVIIVGLILLCAFIIYCKYWN